MDNRETKVVKTAQRFQIFVSELKEGDHVSEMQLASFNKMTIDDLRAYMNINLYPKHEYTCEDHGRVYIICKNHSL